MNYRFALLILFSLGLAVAARAATLVLPQGRHAFYCDERIELAVAGLAKGEAATLTLRPADAQVVGLALPVTGDGGTMTLALPAFSLAPGGYEVYLDPTVTPIHLTIVDGVRPSSLLLSVAGTPADVARAGGTVVTARDLAIGLHDATGVTLADPRAAHSPGVQALEAATALDLPMRVVWTAPIIANGGGVAPPTPDLLNQQRDQVLRHYSHTLLDAAILRLPVVDRTAELVRSPVALLSLLALSRATDPAAKVWCDEPAPSPRTMPDDAALAAGYRLTLNAALAGGVTGISIGTPPALKAEDLAALNAPALCYGPLLSAFTAGDHDVALLWSESELVARQQAPVTTVKIEHLPENSAATARDLLLTPDLTARNYQAQVLLAHQALARAGYPAQIVSERVLAAGGRLREYRVLVVVGQTAALPAELLPAIAAFEKDGGKVVTDPATTVPLPHAVLAEVDLQDPLYRLQAMRELAGTPAGFRTAREASFFRTTYAADAPARDAVAAYRKALRQTKARPAVLTDGSDLACARLVSGDGALLLVLNAREELLRLEDQQTCETLNLTAADATFSLADLVVHRSLMTRLSSRRPPVAYAIEGTDWSRVSRLDDPMTPITARFAAGEMKLYLVAPQAPSGIALTVHPHDAQVDVTARLNDLHMPWPVQVTLLRPDGGVLLTVWRVLDAKGEYRETFPLGRTAPTGTYAVRVSSPVADLRSQAFFDFKATSVDAEPLAAAARVFDGNALQTFLRTKPALTIAVGQVPEHRALAEQLAAGLRAKGCTVEVANEGDVLGPAAPAIDRHVIALGDSGSSVLVAALQASELPWQTADAQYPGPQRALVSWVASPFTLDHHAILIGASDPAGVAAGLAALLALLR